MNYCLRLYFKTAAPASAYLSLSLSLLLYHNPRVNTNNIRSRLFAIVVMMRLVLRPCGGGPRGCNRLWLYLAGVHARVSTSRLQVGVHVATDGARARQSCGVFLVDVS